MATTAVSVECVTDVGDHTLDALTKLIAIRSKELRETTEQAARATVINILSSLVAQTRIAKAKPSKEMYKIERVGEVVIRRVGGKLKRVVKGDHGRKFVNRAYGQKDPGYLYRITLTNPNVRPKETENAPYYLVAANSSKVAEDYAKERMAKILKNERGLAKLALKFAQAKISGNYASANSAFTSPKWRVAKEAAKVSVSGIGFSSGQFGIMVHDSLRYATDALRGGSSALDLAMKKAANRTAGIVNHIAGYRLDQPIGTPFPEVAAKNKEG